MSAKKLCCVTCIEKEFSVCIVTFSDEEIVVSTTRPETMLGDTAVAVNKNDSRYKHLHGTVCVHPFTHKHIPIICDDYASQDIGTGEQKCVIE